MKAIVFREYGMPDKLYLEEVLKPIPKGNEVLIKVHAASINDWDWQLLQGVPFYNRMSNGLFKPKKITILGCDVAGVIEAVGDKVDKFKVGDEVFGDLCQSGFGTFAEYVCANDNAVLHKPTAMTFEQAAALPQAGIIALSSIRAKTNLQAGQKVLINGASGGSGTLTLQMLKDMDLDITAVCSSSKMDLVRSLGAEHVIDYTQQDFTTDNKLYDFIIDVKGFHSVFNYNRVLNKGGDYVMQGGGSGVVMQVLSFGSLISLFSSKKMRLMILKPNDGLDELIKLFNEGKIKPIIDKSFPLSETAEAMEYYGAKKARGKVIISMDEKS